MPKEKTELQERIESGKSILIAEVAPPKGSDGDSVRAVAREFAGKVHALGMSDNRDGVRMSALAAAAIVAQQGVEPILHVATRDRNRVALVSDCLGAAALGVRNLLCTTGAHQTLGASRAARNVFDVDSVQLLQALAGLGADGSLVGESGLDGAGPYCLGGVAAPFADPAEMQVRRVAKKVRAGAQFLITQPVYDLERFEAWWKEVVRQGLHEKTAFVAGIRVPADAAQAAEYAAQRPDPRVPSRVLERLGSKSGAAAQRAEGIEIAIETIGRLKALSGLRGFEIRCDGAEDAVLEVMEKLKTGTE
ncbi:methylenetetrahydrofolate reductase [Candidatus Sumerlaeota bacterium]|nr:methylenetetrahydrofolate reductase [Candidatus Sumerlaeota bacterium]